MPNIGDCSITPGPAPPSPTTSVSSNPRGGGRGCTRCWGPSNGKGWIPEPCSPSSGSRRRLKETGIIPSHVAPVHRALINGCPECSASDLKTAFRAVDNRQSSFQVSLGHKPHSLAQFLAHLIPSIFFHLILFSLSHLT